VSLGREAGGRTEFTAAIVGKARGDSPPRQVLGNCAALPAVSACAVALPQIAAGVMSLSHLTQRLDGQRDAATPMKHRSFARRNLEGDAPRPASMLIKPAPLPGPQMQRPSGSDLGCSNLLRRVCSGNCCSGTCAALALAVGEVRSRDRNSGSNMRALGSANDGTAITVDREGSCKPPPELQIVGEFSQPALSVPGRKTQSS
jgi:hypothetical protein